MATRDGEGPVCPECFEPIEPVRVPRVELAEEHPGLHVVCPNCAEPLLIEGEIGNPTARRATPLSSAERARARWTPPLDGRP